MRAVTLIVTAALVAGCASSRAPGGVGDDDPIDAAATDSASGDGAPALDAPGPDAPVVPSVAAPLLLSEIVLAPTEGELIELMNPGATAVGLDDYYLSDTPQYFRLPAGVTVDTNDFIVRFPAGATIPGHGVITVAIDIAASFTATYPGVTPTYSIGSSTMRIVMSDAATLTNAGEPIVLFYWNGQSDRVTDIDIMIAGTPTAANVLASKSGVAIDGPDGDNATTAYGTDANTLASQGAPGSGKSTKRIAPEAGELQTGSNGIGGQDETSETLGTTWDTTAYTVPTPGTVPAALTP